jgi:hypothetical protein
MLLNGRLQQLSPFRNIFVCVLWGVLTRHCILLLSSYNQMFVVSQFAKDSCIEKNTNLQLLYRWFIMSWIYYGVGVTFTMSKQRHLHCLHFNKFSLFDLFWKVLWILKHRHAIMIDHVKLSSLSFLSFITDVCFLIGHDK